ncbi:DUF427 domain-containing protein [Ruegeria sp. TM1040]|jgi:uncharacterized protein (DUF427 family)|uniref:DUF427 domain-containing protein n=1 Tax=Rhodobacterales TaxID=204455 RepID=UPI00004625D2|nr:DUF427 domain-containing protein [Ruegeria sp. TM1040]ABF63373.1 protein of unknown function DUF427 [Ruegeria sp. TM1040]MDF9302237.1 DUF427 domain-containing protein [Tritonibacter mobilis]
MTKITIQKATGRWVVRSGGAILGETENALELIEGDLAPVIYFPREDIAMAFLDKTDKTSHCPHKGDATYYSIVNRSSTDENAVWSYENPIDAVSEIKGHLAFMPLASVKVEQL